MIDAITNTIFATAAIVAAVPEAAAALILVGFVFGYIFGRL